jgi:ketosteroid isomerase-like protein
MKKCRLNSKLQRENEQSIHSVATVLCIMIAVWLMVTGCANLESDLTVEPSEASIETSIESTQGNKPATEKCVSIGQEITDRLKAYNAAFVAEDVDLLYNDFWPLDHHTFVPNWDKDREEMRAQMTWFYERGNLYSYNLKSLDRYVYKDVVYDFGAGNSTGEMNGTLFTSYDYYFIRWTKENDGVWRVDKNVGGPRGDTSEVIPTTNEGPLVCFNKNQSDQPAVNSEITDRFNAYINALTTGNINQAYEFWSQDIHFYGTGLNADREGLYEHYRQFFETGQILSSKPTLFYRFVHGNVAYDIGQSDDTIVTDDVQSTKKTNYVIRWEKGHSGVWRITRIMEVFRR